MAAIIQWLNRTLTQWQMRDRRLHLSPPTGVNFPSEKQELSPGLLLLFTGTEDVLQLQLGLRGKEKHSRRHLQAAVASGAKRQQLSCQMHNKVPSVVKGTSVEAKTRLPLRAFYCRAAAVLQCTCASSEKSFWSRMHLHFALTIEYSLNLRSSLG